MPLHTYKKINEHSSIFVWEIEESVDWFLSKLHLDEDEVERYRVFRTDQRRVHWLAYRYVLKQIVGKGNDIIVKYNKHNKPFLHLSNDHISVSHSGKYATVIISREQLVGVDIEQVSPRLHRIADKFLSSVETGREIETLSTDELCLHWCAKEALYKLYGDRNLDFREQIRVMHPLAGMEGEFRGVIKIKDVEKEYRLFSEKLDDYYLVYVVDSPDI